MGSLGLCHLGQELTNSAFRQFIFCFGNILEFFFRRLEVVSEWSSAVSQKHTKTPEAPEDPEEPEAPEGPETPETPGGDCRLS